MASYLLTSSGAVPDKYACWTDQDQYLTINGAALDFTSSAGGRIMWLAHTLVTDAGWTSPTFEMIYPECYGDGYAAIAPTVDRDPILRGGTAVHEIVHCIDGRARAFPPPNWWYEWKRDGVTIMDPDFPTEEYSRNYYRLTVADLGADITCTQHWENREGVISATTTAVTVVDAAVPSTTGTVRYVKPSATGTGDGTSWANAYGASSLNKAIREVVAGSGDHVLLAADQGLYSTSAFGTNGIMTGPTSGVVNIVSVDSTTGKKSLAGMTSSRTALNAGPYGLVQPASQGSSAIRIGPLVTSWTVSTGSDILTVSQEFYDQCATGDAVRASKASGSTTYSPEITSTTPVPGGAVNTTMMAVYYVIKSGTNREIKLATSEANALAGTAIDVVTPPVGTQYLTYCGEHGDVSAVDLTANTLTIPADLYGKLRNSAIVAIRTTDTLPSGLDVASNAFCYWPVRKVGDNKIKLYTSGRLAEIDGNPVSLGTAGSGTLSVWINMPTKKAQNLLIEGWDFTDMGNGCFVLAQSHNVHIKNVHVDNCYRGFECLDWTSSVGQRDCGTWDLKIEDFHVYGAERGIFRLRYGHLDTVVEDCSCDGRNIDGDAFPSLFCLEGEAVGSTDQGPIRTTYNYCFGQRARRTYSSSEYWNADIFEDNTPSASISYNNCEARYAADGGFDCKSSNTAYNDCLVAYAKRNYRLWGTNMTLNDCYSFMPQRASEPFGENGGSAHVGIFEADVIATLNDCVFIDAGSTPIIYFGTEVGGDAGPDIFVNNITCIRRPNTNQFTNTFGAFITYTPEYYRGAPTASATPYTSSVTATATVTVTTNQPGGTVEIRPGGDGALFQVSGMNVSSIAPLDPTSPTDSNADGVYQVNLRYYNNNTPFPDFVDFTWTATMVNTANYPSIVATTTANNNANATTHNITLPATITAGQEIVLICVSDGAPTITSPAGFTNLTDNSAVTGVRQRACYKVADGTEDGTTVSFTTSASEKTVIACLLLAPRDTAQAPQIQRAENNSATASPDPTTITPAWGAASNSYLTYVGYDNGLITLNSGATNGGYPTGWTQVLSLTNNAADGVALHIAYLQSNATSVNPPAWSLSGGAVNYRNTIGFKGV